MRPPRRWRRSAGRCELPPAPRPPPCGAEPPRSGRRSLGLGGLLGARRCAERPAQALRIRAAGQPAVERIGPPALKPTVKRRAALEQGRSLLELALPASVLKSARSRRWIWTLPVPYWRISSVAAAT